MYSALTLATWNVNSLRARLDHVVQFLNDNRPDILCLQELKCEVSALPKEAFESIGYRVAAYGQKTYNGVAIISPFPIEDVHEGFSDGPDDPQARVLAATVRGVRVVNVYVPNGSEVGCDKYAYKLAWMERLKNELSHQGAADKPLVLTGDFNVAMGDADVYNPKAWQGRILCSDPERTAAGAWLEWGLSDLFTTHHPEGGIYSWWDYRQGGFAQDRGLRIDHVWATAPLAAQCTACDVIKAPRGWEKPSDHAPVVARFEAPTA